MALALSGLTVLDCSALLPGPLLGKLLRQQGARVIKIESPDRPDPARAMGSIYTDLNAGKEELALNLKDPSDRARFHVLVRSAHGLIEGFRPAAKEKLGLTATALHAINPKICVASLVGYAEEGPLKDRAGHDINFQAQTGCASLFTGMPGLPLADLFSAYEGALRLAVAMRGVESGQFRQGPREVIVMSEVLERVQSSVRAEYQDTGIVPGPGQTLFAGKYPCYRIYHSAEGHKIAVGAIEPKFWEKICAIAQRPDLEDLAYADGESGAWTAEELQKTLAGKPWSHWEPLFEQADCCVERVRSHAEI